MDNNSHWGKLLVYFVVIAILATAGLFIPNMFGGTWMPQQISTQASSIDDLFWGMIILSVIILAAVMAIVVYSVRHFRAEPGDDSDGEPIHGHVRLEVAWMIVPLIIVFVIAGLSYKVLLDDEATPKASAAKLTVFVRAYSFGWKFRETDLGTFITQKQIHRLEVDEHRAPAANLVESPDLVLPIDTTVRFQVMACSGLETPVITHLKEDTVVAQGACVDRFGPPSADQIKQLRQTESTKLFIQGRQGEVNHAFWVPEARLKIDAVSGVPTWTQWTTDTLTTVGTHPQVVCAELCGSGHNAMRTDACIVSQGTWKWWKSKLTPTESIPCVQLKYFTCERASATDTNSEREAMIKHVASVLATKPDATCKDLEETA